jgi:DNA ligase 4
MVSFEYGDADYGMGDKKPDVIVEALERSLVLEVKGAEMIDSEFGLKYTLRFPRLVRIRNDKCSKDCMLVSEVLEMAEMNKKMIRKQLDV